VIVSFFFLAIVVITFPDHMPSLMLSVEIPGGVLQFNIISVLSIVPPKKGRSLENLGLFDPPEFDN
jgi:hypothetical protein